MTFVYSSNQLYTEMSGDISQYEYWIRHFGHRDNGYGAELHHTLSSGTQEYYIKIRIRYTTVLNPSGITSDWVESEHFIISEEDAITLDYHTEGDLIQEIVRGHQYPEPVVIEYGSPLFLVELNIQDLYPTIDRIISARLVVYAFDIDHEDEAKVVCSAYAGHLPETGANEWAVVTLEIAPRMMLLDNYPAILYSTSGSWDYSVDSVALELRYISAGSENPLIDGGWQPSDPPVAGMFNAIAWESIEHITSYWEETFNPSDFLDNNIDEFKVARITFTAQNLGIDEASLLINGTEVATIPHIPNGIIRTHYFSIPEAFVQGTLINPLANNTIRIQAKNGGSIDYHQHHLGLTFDYLIEETGGTQVSGDVYGVWTANNSPYNVIGEITIPSNETLVIEPSV